MAVKVHRNGKKTKLDYYQMTVTYSPGISCQDSIPIMSASLNIEYLYFKNLSNTKRFIVKQRFLYSYYDYD